MITQAMLDAERERAMRQRNLHAGPFTDGWDACLAFLREHGERRVRVVMDAGEVDQSVVVRVEIPAR